MYNPNHDLATLLRKDADFVCTDDRKGRIWSGIRGDLHLEPTHPHVAQGPHSAGPHAPLHGVGGPHSARPHAPLHGLGGGPHGYHSHKKK